MCTLYVYYPPTTFKILIIQNMLIIKLLIKEPELLAIKYILYVSGDILT